MKAYDIWALGAMTVATLALAIGKLTGIIPVPWLVVAMPIWVPVGLSLLVALVSFVLSILWIILERKN